MQNFDFCKKLPRIILVMFQRKPFGLGIFETCFFTLLASEHIFLPQGGLFLQKRPIRAKFSSEMTFSEDKNANFDFERENVPQNASKCVFELGNR